MPEPKIDLEKLKAVKDWSRDLADELDGRTELLPCKARSPKGEDCMQQQSSRYRLTEMKMAKMCKRCQVRWFARMTARGIQFIYDAKTERTLEAAPDYS
jgi:hypothetical protein